MTVYSYLSINNGLSLKDMDRFILLICILFSIDAASNKNIVCFLFVVWDRAIQLNTEFKPGRTDRLNPYLLCPGFILYLVVLLSPSFSHKFNSMPFFISLVAVATDISLNTSR